MSRDYIDDPQEDIAFSLRGIRDALERIADILEVVDVVGIPDPRKPETTTTADKVVFAACPCCGVIR